ncbi:MAG: hypothetical protein ACC661_02160, partial [Verrucomicrobiales bacterium]
VYAEHFLGFGPAFQIPTATEDFLGTGKFSLGPAVGVFRQTENWTWGFIAAQLWSVGGENKRADVSASLIEPLLSYTGVRSTSISLSTEALHNWKDSTWKVPIVLDLGRVFRIGRRPVKISLGTRYYALAERTVPKWGFQAQISLPFRNPRGRYRDESLEEIRARLDSRQ